LSSDAPLVSELVSLPGGAPGLRRWIDVVFERDERVREAFVAEIRALVRIPRDSQHLVPAVDANDVGDPWIVREYSEDGTLADRILSGPRLSGGELLTAAEAVLAALDELTRLGLTHGDPSPSNVLLTRAGGARLADAASCRRAFARRFEPETDLAAADRARAAAWLAAAAAARPEDALCVEVQKALAAGSAEVALFALRRLAERRAASAQPIGRPARREARPPTPPAGSVAVSFSLGPVSDPRVAYQIARAVCDLTHLPLGEVRPKISSRATVFPAALPDAQRLIDECARLRVRIEVRAAQVSKEERP
jgi:serine/threonine protein kinase